MTSERESRYYRRPHDESRGDEFDSWGTAVCFFEIDSDGFAVRQLEDYERGPKLRYNEHYPEDAYGGLSSVAVVTESGEWSGFAISAAEFEACWQRNSTDWLRIEIVADIRLFHDSVPAVATGLYGDGNRSMVFQFPDGDKDINLMATATTKDGSVFVPEELQRDVKVELFARRANSPLIFAGAMFKLWMGKTIGDGRVTRLVQTWDIGDPTNPTK